MKKLFLLIVMLLSLAGVSSAEEMNAEAQSAFSTLKSVGYFATGGVGFAGTISPGEKALNVILKQEKSSSLLQDLLKQGNLAGQMYALAGLLRCDKEAFNKVITPYLSEKATVPTMRGCLASTEPVSVVAERLKISIHPTPTQTKAPKKPAATPNPKSAGQPGKSSGQV